LDKSQPYRKQCGGAWPKLGTVSGLSCSIGAHGFNVVSKYPSKTDWSTLAMPETLCMYTSGSLYEALILYG